MTNLLLRPHELAALTCLIAAEPVPGRPLPERRVLELIVRLIPCDALGGFLFTSTGDLVESVELPGSLARLGQVDGHPFNSLDRPAPVGLRHFLHLSYSADTVTPCLADSICVGFRNGADHVVELWFDRARRAFDARDVALLELMRPALARLVSERPAHQLPERLTTQERRVLMLVTSGCSNPEIADRLCISSSTVRKHLEHAYRKLGVTSRLGAIAVLHGADRPGLDLMARAEKFA